VLEIANNKLNFKGNKMTTLIKLVQWKNLNINEKVNCRTDWIQPGKYSLFRHVVTERPQFTKDIEFIVDALKTSTVEFYERDYKKCWVETLNPNKVNKKSYHLMVYLPNSNLWVNYPTYIKAVHALRDRRR